MKLSLVREVALGLDAGKNDNSGLLGKGRNC
jgi:hypothetical protein